MANLDNLNMGGGMQGGAAFRGRGMAMRGMPTRGIAQRGRGGIAGEPVDHESRTRQLIHSPHHPTRSTGRSTDPDKYS
jgi:hypothetical protein